MFEYLKKRTARAYDVLWLLRIGRVPCDFWLPFVRSEEELLFLFLAVEDLDD